MSTAAPATPASPTIAAPASPTATGGHDRTGFMALFGRGEVAAGYALTQGPLVVSYPFKDIETGRMVPAAAVMMQVSSDPSAPEKAHTVVMAKAAPQGGEGRYFLWCGDALAEGRTPVSQVDGRIGRVVAQYPLSQQADRLAEYREVVGAFSASGPCNFWKIHKEDPAGPGCKHTKHVLGEIARAGQVEELIRHLDERYDAINPAGKPLTGGNGPFVVPAQEGGPVVSSRESIIQGLIKEHPLMGEMFRMSGPGVEHQVPVFILGEAGWGKSETCRIAARAGIFDSVHTFNIHPGIDALDFIGGPQVKSIAKGDGTVERVFIHRDSPVTEAFRDAAAGKTTLLVLEEVGNVANREVLNILKNILNPERGMYSLETGRATGVGRDGLATTEVVRAPVANLTIWGTGNIGEQYSSRGVGADCDMAVMNRVNVLVVRPDRDYAQKVILKEGLLRNHPIEATRGLQRWFDNMWKMAEDRQIDRAPNLRDIAVIINHGKGSKLGMADTIDALANRWAGRDPGGYPIPEQIAVVKETVANALRS